MTNHSDCRSVRARLLDATASDAGPACAAHLEACRACAELVARERRLVGWLSSLPAAPSVELRAPQLPSSTGGRLLPWRVPAWAATAAAAVAMVAFAWKATLPSGRNVHLVRIERVVDVAEAPPPQDERLLALTAGIEAVAMRRPTEIR